MTSSGHAYLDRHHAEKSRRTMQKIFGVGFLYEGTGQGLLIDSNGKKWKLGIP